MGYAPTETTTVTSPISRLERTPLSQLSLNEVRTLLKNYEQSVTFAMSASGLSQRMQRIYTHLLKWITMPTEEFSDIKDVERVSQAVSKDKISILLPADEMGQLVTPSMLRVIELKQEEAAKVEFAKQKSAEDAYGK